MVGNFFVGNHFLQNYKICKYFLQNLLRKVFYTKYFARKLVAITCKFFFTTKICSYFLRKKILKQNWQEIWVFLIVFPHFHISPQYMEWPFFQHPLISEKIILCHFLESLFFLTLFLLWIIFISFSNLETGLLKKITISDLDYSERVVENKRKRYIYNILSCFKPLR